MTAPVIDEWTSSLSSANRHRRADAAVKLGQHSVMPALPALRTMACDKDAIVAISAMYACWKLGEDRVEIDRILDVLDSGSEEVVQQAVETVSAIGPQLVPRIEPLLGGKQPEAILALRLLEEIGGSAAREAIRAMQNPNPDVVMLAKEILDDWDDENEVQIRTATRNDIKALVEIENACFAGQPYGDHRFDERQYRYYVRNNNAIVLIATREAEPVGSSVAIAGTGQRRASGRILSIAVITAARGQGTGTELLMQTISDLRVRGCERIYLEVADTAQDAKRLFESQGFRAIRKLPDYYGSSVDATRMLLTVTTYPD